MPGRAWSKVWSSFPNTCTWSRKLVMTKMTRMSGLPEALAMRFANQGGRWPSYKISNEAFVWPISLKHERVTDQLYKMSKFNVLLGARPRGRKDFSPYEKVGPNLGCCTFQIEVMINAIHFWDLILFKFFLITTIGSWNIVLDTVAKWSYNERNVNPYSQGRRAESWRVVEKYEVFMKSRY